jgi:tetratricopeptide (TPR) repeat protein
LGASTAGLLAPALGQGPWLAASALLPERVEELVRARQFFGQAIEHRQRIVKALPSQIRHRMEFVWDHAHLGLLEKRLGRYDEAAKAQSQAVALCGRLVEDFPNRADLEHSLGGVLHNLAEMQKLQGRLADARRNLEEAISHQQAALKLNPRNRQSRRFLSNHYSMLADVLIHQEDHAAAVQAAEKSAAALPDSGDKCTFAASFVGRCVPLAARDASLPEEKRQELARTYAEQAMRLLREGVAKGDHAVAFLRADAGFASLRGRADFQQLLVDVEARAKEAAR